LQVHNEETEEEQNRRLSEIVRMQE